MKQDSIWIKQDVWDTNVNFMKKKEMLLSILGFKHEYTKEEIAEAEKIVEEHFKKHFVL